MGRFTTPVKHLCLCRECSANKVVDQCPICSAKIQSKMDVFHIITILGEKKVKVGVLREEEVSLEEERRRVLVYPFYPL